jgi:hypothetical protein
VQQAFPHCLSQPGPASLQGVGNYTLDLASAKGPSRRLYFLDSLGAGPEGVSTYAWITPGQINWFRERAAEARGLPGLAFFHIPLPEFHEVWARGGCLGEKHEDVCSPKVNSGLFSAMLETKAVCGVFCGHDHINDYEGSLHGIRLVYGRGGGYNAYGREHYPHGARVIRLKDGEAGFETWQRLETGDRLIHGDGLGAPA